MVARNNPCALCNEEKFIVLCSGKIRNRIFGKLTNFDTNIVKFSGHGMV